MMRIKRYLKKLRRKLNREYLCSQFSRQYVYENRYENENDDPAGMFAGFDAVRKEMDPHIDAAWIEIRKWISRGHGGGLLSALTLAGSQTLSGSLKASVFWLVVMFLCGLAILLLRQVVLAWKLEEAKTGQMGLIVDVDSGFNPAPAFDIIARLLDYLAILALIAGIAIGVGVLFGLTSDTTVSLPSS